MYLRAFCTSSSGPSGGGRWKLEQDHFTLIAFIVIESLVNYIRGAMVVFLEAIVLYGTLSNRSSQGNLLIVFIVCFPSGGLFWPSLVMYRCLQKEMECREVCGAWGRRRRCVCGETERWKGKEGHVCGETG